MNISSIVNQINNAVSLNSADIQSAGSIEQSLRNGLESLMSKSDNAVLMGKVMSFDGENIILSTGNNELVNARFEGGTPPTPGQMMSFMIKGVNTGKIALTPLFENTSQVSTVNNALEAANLPKTAELQYMVKTMMSEGLPIDKKSLYEMNIASRELDTDVVNLAQMKRLNLPLDENNVRQFENYKNYEHQITNTFKDISSDIAESFKMVISNGSSTPAEALKFLSETMDYFRSDDFGINNKLGQDNNALIKELTSQEASNLNALAGEIETEINNNGFIDPSKYTKEDLESLVDNLKALDYPEEGIENLKSGNAPQKMLIDLSFDILKDAVSSDSLPNDNKLKDAFLKLMDTEIFKSSLKNVLTDKFLLTPEDLKEEGKVSKAYEKLNEQIRVLSDNLTQQNKADTPIAQTLNNISSNIDFMNNLNHMFNYVQIPLKMMDKEKSGELYVYTNKKSLAQKDGTVSALLHLDMDHLGPMNVHVTLNENNNVKTKFYLNDDSALDLIADNIELLNKRLNDRGYSVSSEFINDSDPKSVIENILDDNKNISTLSINSFDARA